nr:MAG TPA: hypothetical protein [Caudoviricetes sp.]
MFTIRVKCFNPYTNENVYKHFDWHEDSGRLCEVASDSAYAAGICEVEDEAIRRALKLCDEHGLKVLSYLYFEE